MARAVEPTRVIPAPHAPGIMLVPRPGAREAPQSGWVAFVATMLFLSALGNLVWGLFAILNDYYFTGDTLMAGYHSLWGWMYIGYAVFLLLIIPPVLLRQAVGVVLALAAVTVNVVTHILGFGHRPGWSIVALALDALVLMALVSHVLPAPRDR
jgi:hypothetical protein